MPGLRRRSAAGARAHGPRERRAVRRRVGREPRADRLAAQGVGAVNPSQGLAALEHLLAEDRIQTAVVPIDWRRYVEKPGHAGLPAFLTDVVGTANIPDMAFYRLEGITLNDDLSVPENAAWIPLTTDLTAPVTGGVLAQIDTTKLPRQPKPGQKIHIKTATMGSYFATIEGGRAIRLKRDR